MAVTLNESSISSTGDVSRANMVVIPTIVTTVVALILTVLRMYVRVRLIKMVDWDDYFNLLAMATQIAVLGLIMGAVNYGLGRHFEYLDPASASYGIMLLRICEFLLIMSTVFVKISISLFLKRLFIQNQNWQRFFWAFIAFNTITSMVDAIAIFPQCTPVEYNWNKGIKGGRCWSDAAINALGIAQGTIATVTDIFLSVLPIIFLWNLKMIWRVKLGICGIMALGFASGGFAVARTALVPSLTATHDPTWDLAPLFMWAVLEAVFGVIAAAAPSVRPLLGRNAVTTKYTSSKSKSQTQSLPLHSMPSHISSRGSWLLRSQNTHMQKLRDEDDTDQGLDRAGSQDNLWKSNKGGIIKTTNIHVSHSDAPQETANLGRGNPDL